MRIILPFFWDLSLFQVFFLLFRYFLLWDGYQGSIYNLTALSLIPLLVQVG